jgi:glycosyltransferase involved in cell wall biosynthesis
VAPDSDERHPLSQLRVFAMGPRDGGVADSFSQTLAHLADSEDCEVTATRVVDGRWPVMSAVGLLGRWRTHLIRANVIHVELGSNDRTMFWVSLLISLCSRRLLVLVHDYPLMSHSPAVGLMPSAGRWTSAFAHRILSPLLDHSLRRLLLRRAGAVAVMNQEARDAWSPDTRRVPLLLPHGVFPTSQLPNVAPSLARYALFAGFVGPAKGLDLLLDAWAASAHTGEMELIVASDFGQISDPDILRSHRRASATNSPPRWVGFQEDEHALQSMIAQAAVIVLPYRRSSPASGILTRAMLEGRCVVASAVPAAVSAIEDGVSGLLVTPGDVNALTASIQRVIRDPALRDRLGENARSTARAAFSSTRQTDLLIAGYRSLAAGSPGRS